MRNAISKTIIYKYCFQSEIFKENESLELVEVKKLEILYFHKKKKKQMCYISSCFLEIPKKLKDFQ
jgi:hypothetical protein